MKKILYTIPIILLIGIVFITTTNAKNYVEEDTDYSMKYFYDTKEDGWEYAFKIYFGTDSNKYSFNGYNLKYEEMDGYYIPVIDSDTGEVLDKIAPSVITLSVSEKYSGDVKKINEFFAKKQFIDQITLNDLSELDISNFDKQYIMVLFNNAISSEMLSEKGKYAENKLFGRVEVESSDNDMKGIWKLSYIIDYGNISKVYIDFENENGSHLKDNNNIDYITTLENSIISDSNTKTSNYNIMNEINNNHSVSEKVSKNVKNDLNNLIQKMYEKLDSNN